MSILGNNPLAQSIAALPQAERLQQAKPKPAEKAKPGTQRREEDAFEPAVEETEQSDAVKSVASNEREDAREDHREHRPNPGPPKPPGSTLDLNA